MCVISKSADVYKKPKQFDLQIWQDNLQLDKISEYVQLSRREGRNLIVGQVTEK